MRIYIDVQASWLTERIAGSLFKNLRGENNSTLASTLFAQNRLKSFKSLKLINISRVDSVWNILIKIISVLSFKKNPFERKEWVQTVT